MGHAFWKENIEDLLLESNILNCCLKITMADLRKITELKIRENTAIRFERL